MPRPPLQVPPNCDLTLGLVCVDKSEPGRTVWQMGADQRFANPYAVVQGGFLAACCDSAMAASAVSFAAGRRVRVTTTDLSVSFLRPAPVGTVLTCDASVVSGGRRVAFLEATVTDGDGRAVARARSTYLYIERDDA